MIMIGVVDVAHWAWYELDEKGSANAATKERGSSCGTKCSNIHVVEVQKR